MLPHTDPIGKNLKSDKIKCCWKHGGRESVYTLVMHLLIEPIIPESPTLEDTLWTTAENQQPTSSNSSRWYEPRRNALRRSTYTYPGIILQQQIF